MLDRSIMRKIEDWILQADLPALEEFNKIVKDLYSIRYHAIHEQRILRGASPDPQQVVAAFKGQKTASSSDELHDLAMARMNETKGDIGRVMDELMSKHGYDVLNPQEWEEFEQEIANWWNDLPEES